MCLVLAAMVYRVDHVFGTVEVVVGHEHVLEPAAIGGDLGDRLADSAGAHKQNSHQSAILAMTCLTIV